MYLLLEREREKRKKKTPTRDKQFINCRHALHQKKGDVVALLRTQWMTRFEQPVTSQTSPKEHRHHQRVDT